ncbi:predicted protein [Nematostella vectensis]|uniref:JmjC domain-containing protein n=1 Tax=Nematostella vectensis TaxID=45351 RepID=A7ST01_NEMVE|nr:predicted protein [Nematostella vectensis]|eukprot:XP_001625270.1 predicted protein [Nematostella vectensis]
MARENHYEFCHFDPDDNFLIMVHGRKRVRLFGGRLSPLYPNELGSKGRTIQSQVNCDKPDLDKFPEFVNAVMYEFPLSSCKMLFFPAFWWHQVTSLEMSISINMFFGDAGDNNYLTKIMSPPWAEGFHYWFLNIIEQNRETPSFHRLLSELPGAIRNFLITQWKEYATEEQVYELVQLAMKHCGIDKLPLTDKTANNPKKLKIRGLLWRK